MHNRKKFEEEIQKILDKCQFHRESRRQIFSLLMAVVEKQQTTEKAIPNDKTSESSESTT